MFIHSVAHVLVRFTLCNRDFFLSLKSAAATGNSAKIYSWSMSSRNRFFSPGFMFFCRRAGITDFSTPFEIPSSTSSKPHFKTRPNRPAVQSPEEHSSDSLRSPVKSRHLPSVDVDFFVLPKGWRAWRPISRASSMTSFLVRQESHFGFFFRQKNAMGP